MTTLFLSSLPFGLYAEGQNVDRLSRDFPVQSEAVAPVLPVQADFSGGGYPYMLFVGRKGQIIRMDLFGEKAVNHNLFVAASSGSGESFVVNYLAYNYYSANAMVRIIDIGGSYKKMTGMFQARYLDFDESSNICLNPFTHIYEAEKDLQSISAVVAAMCFSHTGKAPEAVAELAHVSYPAGRLLGLRKRGEPRLDRYGLPLPCHVPRRIAGNLFRHYDKEDKKKFTDIAQTLAFTLEAFTSDTLLGSGFRVRRHSRSPPTSSSSSSWRTSSRKRRSST